MEQVIKKRLQQVMDASVAKGETPGCLLMVIKDGEEQVYLESGYADIEAKKPVSRDNIFRLYSMSKPITATAMMILVERGIVDLADPVDAHAAESGQGVVVEPFAADRCVFAVLLGSA